MEKNKNKFIYFIIVLIIWIISISIFIWYFFKSVDRNSYVELVKWKAVLNENLLILNERKKISENDIIQTLDKDSLAVIEWWDWSITRLWWNTKIEIKNAFTSKNKNIVQIAFNTLSWKTWSNVVSYLWEDSHFYQYYNDTEIAVRWTIYSVDIEKDYLQVENHLVTIKNDKVWEMEIPEKKQIKLTDFSFISLDDFINYFKDKWFFELNTKLDKEYFIKLTADIEKNIDNLVSFSSRKIGELTEEKRKILYETYLENYQKLNFVSLKDSEKLFNLKLELKEKLLHLAPENQKEWILKSFNYDLKEIFDYKKFVNFEKIINIYKENEKYIEQDAMYKFLKDFNQNFDPLGNFSSSLDSFTSSIKNNPLYKEIFSSLWENIKNSVNETISSQKNAFQKFVEFMKNLFN